MLGGIIITTKLSASENTIPDSLANMRGIFVISVFFFFVLAVNLSAFFSVYTFVKKSRVFLQAFSNYAMLNFGAVWFGVQVTALVAASSYLIWTLCCVFLDVQYKLNTKLKPSFNIWRVNIQKKSDSKHEKDMYVRKRFEVIYFTMLIALFAMSSIAHALSIVSMFCLFVINSNINTFSPLGALLGFCIVLSASSLMVQFLLRSAYIRTRRWVIDKIANFITFNSINKPHKQAVSSYTKISTLLKDMSTQTDSDNRFLRDSPAHTPYFISPRTTLNNKSDTYKVLSHNSDLGSISTEGWRIRSDSEISTYSTHHNVTPTKSPRQGHAYLDGGEIAFNGQSSISNTPGAQAGSDTAMSRCSSPSGKGIGTKGNSIGQNLFPPATGRDSPFLHTSRGGIHSPRSFLLSPTITPSVSSSEDLYKMKPSKLGSKLRRSASDCI